MFYRGLSSCLLELIDVCKATQTPDGKNLFNELLIHLASDFNRMPRANGSGSDHGFNGASTTLISGAIQGLKITGNIAINPGASFPNVASYPGTWGFAAPFQGTFMSGRKVNAGNLASTISTILRIPSPSPNDPSLVVESSGNIATLAEPTRNVP
jgi:uncharacterized protein (DUF1501 family)